MVVPTQIDAGRQAPALRRPWLSALAATVLASGWALFTSPSEDGDIAKRTGETVPAAGGPDQGAVAPSAAELPQDLELQSLDAASFDPFEGTAPVSDSPLPSKVASVLPVVVPIAAPPAQLVPPVGHRFVGRMVTPGGQVLTFVGNSDQVILATPGVLLDSGHVVEAVDDQSLTLRNPQMNSQTRLAIDAANVEPLRGDLR